MTHHVFPLKRRQLLLTSFYHFIFLFFAVLSIFLSLSFLCHNQNYSFRVIKNIFIASHSNILSLSQHIENEFENIRRCNYTIWSKDEIRKLELKTVCDCCIATEEKKKLRVQ